MIEIATSLLDIKRENIVKEVTGKFRIEVKKVELYQEEVSITADSFTDEEIEAIINRILMKVFSRFN